ncbi:MAG: tryptophan synthase subunit alpha [Vulcanimicrobiaceae bacterium]
MKVAAAFASAKAQARPAFIPYLMAGDPDFATTQLLIDTLEAGGADMLELGVPYSDPLADGPTIAAAGQRALAQGVGIERVLWLISKVRLPVVLFTYYNPLLQYGLENFAEDAARNGLAAVIVPDLALEEAGPLRSALHSSDIDMPLLVAPATDAERSRRIASASSGFVYVVSRLGVTGAASAPDFLQLKHQITMVKSTTALPVVAGFGISTPAHLGALSSLVDGIVVGSAIVEAYGSTRGAQAAGLVGRFVENLLTGVQHARH